MEGVNLESNNPNESVSTWKQVYRLVRESLDIKGIPPPADANGISPDEHRASFALMNIMQDFTDGIDAELIDIHSVKRLVDAALDEKSYLSYVKSLSSPAGVVGALNYFSRNHSEFFSDEDFEDIKSSWGVIDSRLIYEKYVKDRIPQELIAASWSRKPK